MKLIFVARKRIADLQWSSHFGKSIYEILSIWFRKIFISLILFTNSAMIYQIFSVECMWKTFFKAGLKHGYNPDWKHSQLEILHSVQRKCFTTSSANFSLIFFANNQNIDNIQFLNRSLLLNVVEAPKFGNNYASFWNFYSQYSRQIRK